MSLLRNKISLTINAYKKPLCHFWRTNCVWALNDDSTSLMGELIYVAKGQSWTYVRWYKYKILVVVRNVLVSTLQRQIRSETSKRKSELRVPPTTWKWFRFLWYMAFIDVAHLSVYAITSLYSLQCVANNMWVPPSSNTRRLAKVPFNYLPNFIIVDGLP